jgi:hypothetical protein
MRRRTVQIAPAHLHLDELEMLRLKLHRLSPARPLRSVTAATAFIRERHMVMSTGHASLPVLSEAIAGRHLPGSWMAHAEAARIYKILGRMARSPIVAAPIVLGKETLCDPSLGPAVERVAHDPRRRHMVLKALPPLARRLLATVEAEGQLRMDRWGAPTRNARPARLLLERQLLVTSSSLHTERGYHTSLVIPWALSTISQRVAPQARKISFSDAEDQLLIAAVHAAVLAPEREVRRWFVFGGERIETLLAQEQLVRVLSGSGSYFTTPRLWTSVRHS